ncbi:MAG: SpoIID/LytB domain-containing protein [Pseudonocardiales bacterium]
MDPRAQRRERTIAAMGAAALLLSTAVLATGSWLAAPANAEAISLPANSVTVALRGNGHGHGMSQYGARGAAIAGLSTAAILAFYYPGTSLVTLGASTVRVLVSGTGSSTVVAPSSDLRVTAISTVLPTSGISRYRLVASGTGVALQRLVGATWSTVRTGLANGTEFYRPSGGGVRLYLADGSSATYRGALRALRVGSGVSTVNRVSLDGYVAGVVPREMPSSWPAAAVQAQAVAARSYGRNAVESHGGQSWDICDTTQCQVYGGMTRYDRAGAVLWTEDLAALSGNANQVLRYGGRTIFAQFSASNGGWTVDGGQPYLIARADNYDNAASGDPYLSYTQQVPVASIAGHYGLAKATSIQITARDGHGTWGGRMTAGFVNGLDAQGTAQHIATTGFGLQAAMGVGTTWFSIQADQRPVGQFEGFTPVAPRIMQMSGWTFDPDHTDLPGQLVLTVDGVSRPGQYTTTRRADVQRAYGTVTSTLGFSVRVRVGAGPHTACLYGVDRDGLGRRALGCRTAWMPDVLGSLAAATRTGLHTVRVTGWSFDPSHGANQGRIQVRVDGIARSIMLTTLARPDVQRTYLTAGNTFGYDLTITLTPGTHQVCVHGVDQDGHGSVPLGCRPVSVPQNPLGRVEAVHHVTSGYQISGWTFDPDVNGGSTTVQVYINGVLARTINATAARPDVQRAYGLVNSAVGFSALVPSSTAKHAIMIRAVNTGGGADTVLVSGWA